MPSTHGEALNSRWYHERVAGSAPRQKHFQGIRRGSTDIYFGPKAPEGNDSNWIPSKAGGRYLLLFRFYKPGKEVADKTWQLPDIVRTN